MTFCNKCGGQISDNLKYCDKCGALIDHSSDSDDSNVTNDLPDGYQEYVSKQPENKKTSGDKTDGSKLDSNHSIMLKSVMSVIPEPLKKRGNNLSLFIGVGSLAVLAITYFFCFVFFMGDISTPVSYEAIGADGANWFWMVAYFIVNLTPLAFAVYAFFKPDFRKYALFGAMFLFTLTVFALIAWGMCEAGNFTEALLLYGSAKSGTFAWYTLMDCLSEAWYLKLPFTLCAVFGLGLDFIVNRNKK